MLNYGLIQSIFSLRVDGSVSQHSSCTQRDIQTEAGRIKQKEKRVSAGVRLTRRTTGALLHWAVVWRGMCGRHRHTLGGRVLGSAKAHVQPFIQVSSQFVCELCSDGLRAVA